MASDKTVKVRLVADVAPYAKGMRDASTATLKLGGDISATGTSATAAASKMGGASATTVASLRRVQNAQDTLRIAEMRLADARSKGVSGTRLAASEAAVEKAKRGLASATDAHTKALKSEADAAGKSAEKSQGLTDRLKGLKGMAAGVAGTALVAFLKDSVQAAGDLQQSIGGVDSVFKDTADEVHAFGKTSAESVGLSRNSFNELITVTGALLKNKGLEDFTGKSLQLVTVGADLAATFGGSTKDAVEALNAAMRGESDPIERYGISLNETAVNAELASKGLKGLTGGALEQAKAQARIDIVMRQSADAMGQFARESDTLQGQQQRLTAKWEDAQATLGQALLPALTKVVQALSWGVDAAVAVAGAFGAVPGPVKAAVAALVALHLLRGPLSGMVATTVAGMKSIAGSVAGAAASAAGAKAALGGVMGALGGPWGIAIMGATAAIGGWMQAQANARQAAEDFGATLDDVTGKFTEQSRVLAQEKFFKDFAQTDYSKVSASLETAGVALGDLVAAYEQGGPKVDEFKAKFDAWRKSQEAMDLARQGVNIEALGNSYAALGRDMEAGAAIAKINADTQAQVEKATVGATEATDGATRAAKDQKPAIQGVVEAAQALAKETIAAEEASRKLASAMLEVTSAARGADEAEAAYQAALAKAREELVKNKNAIDQKTGSFKLNTEAGRVNSGILVDLSAKAEANARAQLENGAAVDVVKGKMAQQREEFVALGIKMGLSKAQANALATEYGLTGETVEALSTEMGEVPREVKSKVTVDTSQAFQAVGAVNKLLGSIGDITVKMFAQQAGGGWGGAPGGGAKGGGKSPVGVGASFPWGRYPSGGVHRAYDYAVPTGTPVRSPFSGRVILAGWDPTGFGHHIRTADSDGNYSIFAHLSRIGVKMGQSFAAGSVLGYSGNSGRSTGPHLHWERRRSPYSPGTAFKPYAGGGPVAGFSPHPTADNIPIMATADEYMIRHASAKKLGRAKLDWINATGTLPLHLANGGPVTRMPQATRVLVQSTGADAADAAVLLGELRRLVPELREGVRAGAREGIDRTARRAVMQGVRA